MVIERNAVGCPGPHDGVFLILIENVDLFEDGISLIDIINTLQARRAGTDPVCLRRIRLSDDIRSANILMFAWSFYAASAGIPAFAALFWKKATKTGVMAGLLGGFVVCVGWKLAGQPFGLGAAVPGTVACGIALVVVSLATYKRAPSVFLKAEKQS